MGLDEQAKQPSTAPSLLDPHSTGGVYAGDGFLVQDRYLALRMADWLMDPDFDRLQAERAEDIDVWVEREARRDHHQVKNEPLTTGQVKKLIGEFRGRYQVMIEAGRLRWFVIAFQYPGSDLRGFLGKLALHRQHYFGPGDSAERTASESNLRARATQLGLGDHFDFILQHVRFDTDLNGLDLRDGEPRSLLAVKLLRLLDIDSMSEAGHVADRLLARISDNRVRAWSRADLDELISAARQEYRAGPPRPRGDLVMICHETLKRVDRHPEEEDIPELTRDRRLNAVQIDHTALLAAKTPEAIALAAAKLAAPGGEFRAALDRNGGAILYYGFPHVPFGVLAGYLSQAHRSVALLEHDLESGRFHWRPASGASVGATHVTAVGSGRVARLRVSVSALVREEQCDAALDPSKLRIDLHVQAQDLGRGTVRTEAQAKSYASTIRAALDRAVAGSPEFDALHVFAAVPVSVAFVLGQVLSHTSLPSAFVHNFDFGDNPPYRWNLSLSEAAAGTSCVRFIERQK
jgi:hypothetical protein